MYRDELYNKYKIINLTILECKCGTYGVMPELFIDNKSNHIGM